MLPSTVLIGLVGELWRHHNAHRAQSQGKRLALPGRRLYACAAPCVDKPARRPAPQSSGH